MEKNSVLVRFADRTVLPEAGRPNEIGFNFNIYRTHYKTERYDYAYKFEDFVADCGGYLVCFS